MTVGERRLSPSQAWIVIGSLAAVVILNAGLLGSDPWAFRPGAISPTGPLAPLVRLADEHWDLGLLRSLTMLGGVGVAGLAVAACLVRRWPPWVLAASCVLVLATLTVPAVALQAGLREASQPWFFVNDSTYQIELAGDLVLDGKTPYGHDYDGSGLERFYSLDGSAPAAGEPEPVALRHFAYFPGTPLLAAVWRILPSPWDDFRWLVALSTLGLFGAALVFPGPLHTRLALGVAAAGNPIAVRAAWFGTADAVSLLLLALAFGLLVRRRDGWAAAALAAAVLTKQFAVVGVPFFVASLLVRGPRAAWKRPAAVFAAVLATGFLPFVVSDASALWRDTISYGAGTYRIVGYGLSALLLRAHVIGDRNGSYPFFLAVALVWLPATFILVRAQLRSGLLWLGGAGFTASVFVLLYLGRVFQISYLVYPLTGLVLTALLALAAERGAGREDGRPGLARDRRDQSDETQEGPGDRILEEGVVEEAVNGDRHE